MNVLGYSDFEKLFQNHEQETSLVDFFLNFSVGALKIEQNDDVNDATTNLLACLTASVIARDIQLEEYHLASKEISINELKTVDSKVEMSEKLYTSFSLVVDDDISDINEISMEDVKRFNASVDKLLRGEEEENEITFIDCESIPSFIVVSLFIEGEEISLVFEKRK
ncbi:MAG: hypothetical protein ACK5N8_07950 [Alphaproteobacteria bacterium]